MTLARDSIEKEAKLDVGLSFCVPDLRDLVDGTRRLPESHLWSRYFDTPDLRLWRRRITLRHRSKGPADEGVWTLKLPQQNRGGSLDRREIEWFAPREHIPEAAAVLLQGLTGRAALGEVACIETRRRTLALGGRHDPDWGELDDDIVTIHGGPHDEQRFRQIELEMGEDPNGLAQGILDRLERAGAHRGDAQPKLARALADAGPSGTVAPEIGRHASISQIVLSSIANGLNRILDHEYLLRVDELAPPAHAVHQTRVGARRLRSDLKTFGKVLDPIWVRHVRRELKWLGDALGEVRDVDVMMDGLEDRADSADPWGHASLVAKLDDQRRRGGH